MPAARHRGRTRVPTDYSPPVPPLFFHFFRDRTSPHFEIGLQYLSLSIYIYIYIYIYMYILYIYIFNIRSQIGRLRRGDIRSRLALLPRWERPFLKKGVLATVFLFFEKQWPRLILWSHQTQIRPV